jgi:hypothetical protein
MNSLFRSLTFFLKRFLLFGLWAKGAGNADGGSLQQTNSLTAMIVKLNPNGISKLFFCGAPSLPSINPY